MLVVVSKLAGSSSGFDSANVSSGCGEALEHLSKVASALSLTFFIAVQKKAGDSMYPIGIEMWYLAIFNLSAIYFRIMKVTKGAYYVRTNMCIYASAR